MNEIRDERLQVMLSPEELVALDDFRFKHRMYFIANGEVEVDLPGKKVRLDDGAFFGEMALLGNNLRSANITTTRLSKLLVLDLVDFRLLMARHPDLAQTIDAEAKRRALENK